MHENDNYLVRVRRFADAKPPFGWEFCRGAASHVVQRSTQTFATRVEALIDSAQIAAVLVLPVDLTPSLTDDLHVESEQPPGARRREA
jgi:hypothetical protein